MLKNKKTLVALVIVGIVVTVLALNTEVSVVFSKDAVSEKTADLIESLENLEETMKKIETEHLDPVKNKKLIEDSQNTRKTILEKIELLKPIQAEAKSLEKQIDDCQISISASDGLIKKMKEIKSIKPEAIQELEAKKKQSKENLKKLLEEYKKLEKQTKNF